MKFVATIEARMSSSRLPGKVLMMAAGQPMLSHLVRRLRSVPSIDEILIATTINPADDLIVQCAEELGIGNYRGSEDDVLGRVLGAAESANADVIVEITGDCPILDPDLTEQTIRTFKAHDAEYVSNCHIRSFPDGMDVQVFSTAALRHAASLTTEKRDREHVSLFIRNHPEIFRQVHVIAPPSLHWPDLGLTLDEAGDYSLIRRIIEHFEPEKPLFGCLDVVQLIRTHAEWLEANKDVRRKGDH